MVHHAVPRRPGSIDSLSSYLREEVETVRFFFGIVIEGERCGVSPPVLHLSAGSYFSSLDYAFELILLYRQA